MSAYPEFALAFRHTVSRDFSAVIARVTGAPVHVALVFGDTLIEAAPGGVREVPTEYALTRGQWTVVPVAGADRDAAYAFARAQLGRPYDYVGVVLAWWFGRPAGGWYRTFWFCSELAAAALIAGGVRLARHRPGWYTPRRLFDTVRPWLLQL